MTNKYSRHQSVVSRQSDAPESEDHWMKQFQKTLEKGAVQPRDERSIFDQINSIMNTKSKHPSVAAAVEDMKERSGLTAYLDKISKTSTEEIVLMSKKTAADENAVIDKTIPIVVNKCPGIKSTLENYVRDTRGNLPVPAIIDKIRSIHKKDVSDDKDWEDDRLIHLVSRMNLEAKKNNPSGVDNYSNLGRQDNQSAGDDIDPENTDAFHGLMPNKM